MNEISRFDGSSFKAPKNVRPEAQTPIKKLTTHPAAEVNNLRLKERVISGNLFYGVPPKK